MPRRFIVLGTSELAREVALVVEHINETFEFSKFDLGFMFCPTFQKIRTW
jgi:hypothetical protein